MKLFTIGSNEKSAKQFFELLSDNKIDILLDIRLNNTSQLTGFTKGGAEYLGYLLDKVCSIKYKHDLLLAPSKELFEERRKGDLKGEDYIIKFSQLIEERKMLDYLYATYLKHYDNVCIMCSEESEKDCHRGIIAAQISKKFDLKVIHLK